MDMFKELLNTEPFNVSSSGETTEWWNIDHRFSITDNGLTYSVEFEGEEPVEGLGEAEVVAMLERKLGIEGLLEDYKLLLDREAPLE